MFAQTMVKPVYGIPKVAVTERSATQSDKSERGVRPEDVIVQDSYIASGGTTSAPIFLNTAYSAKNAYRTYQNVMDATAVTDWQEVEAKQADYAMPDPFLDRLLTLTNLFKSAEMNGNLQAMRAAYDEAFVLRKMRTVSTKENR